MSQSSQEFNNSFWKFLVSVEELNEKRPLVEFCENLSINEATFLEFVLRVKKLNLTIKFDDDFIYPYSALESVKIELTPVEWMSLQHVITQADQSLDDYAFKTISMKMSDLQMNLKKYTLNKKEVTKKAKVANSEALINRLESAVMFRSNVKLHFKDNTNIHVYPHRLVFIEGVLCFVGESLSDHTLSYYELENIDSIDAIAENSTPLFSPFEINNFISNLRLVNGKEERLVFKIHGNEQLNLLPAHHHLGNPYVTTNGEGEMIWAASVEMCDDVYQWLYSMKEYVEILDPGHIRKEFAQYCALKENGYSKKVS